MLLNAMSVPRWLQDLRRSEIVEVVQARSDPGTLLGVPMDRVMEALGWGRADFTKPWEHLDIDDRALLYGHYLQVGHLQELMESFRQLVRGTALTNPVVIDLGCGPFTGGLAFAAIHGRPFTYVGMDRAESMFRLGERLARGAVEASGIPIEWRWTGALDEVMWTEAPGWRPIIVIVSYLLASDTLDPVTLVADLETVIARIGRGPVTVLYTNAVGEEKNRKFPAFRETLEGCGFELIKDDQGHVTGERRVRELRYALFHRRARTTLELGDA